MVYRINPVKPLASKRPMLLPCSTSRVGLLLALVLISFDQLAMSQSLVNPTDGSVKEASPKLLPSSGATGAEPENPMHEALRGVDLRRTRLKNRLLDSTSGKTPVKVFSYGKAGLLPSSPVKSSALASMAKINFVAEPADAWDEVQGSTEVRPRLVVYSQLIDELTSDKWKQVRDYARSQAATQQPGSDLGVSTLMRGVASMVQQVSGMAPLRQPLPSGIAFNIPSQQGELKAVYNSSIKRYAFDMKFVVPFHRTPLSSGSLPVQYGTTDGKPWIFHSLEYKVDLDCDGDSTGWQLLPSSQTRRDISVVQFDYSPIRAFRLGNTWLQQRDACISVRARGSNGSGQLSSVSVESNTVRLRLKAPDANPFILIGMGDSYGSGEGNPFNPSQRNSHRAPDTIEWWQPGAFGDLGLASRDPYLEATAALCHRSSKSGVGKAARAIYDGNQQTGLNMAFAHVACSGATSRKFFEDYSPGFEENWFYINSKNFGPSFRESDILRNRQTQNEPGGEREFLREVERIGAYKDNSVDPQLWQAVWWANKYFSNQSQGSGEAVDAVIVSIGGNDAKFSQFIKDCVIMPGDCYNEDSTKNDFSKINARVRSAVYWVAGGVQQRFPNAKIYFTLYTDGLSKRPSPGACSENDERSNSEYASGVFGDPFWDLPLVDALFLKRVIEDINRSIREQVSALTAWRIATPERQQSMAANLIDQFPDTAPNLYRPRPLRPNVATIGKQFYDHRDNGFCVQGRRVIMFSDEAGPRQGFDHGGIWSSGGFHPNDYGYSLYAASIVEALTSSHEFRRSWPSPVPATPTYAVIPPGF